LRAASSGLIPAPQQLFAHQLPNAGAVIDPHLDTAKHRILNPVPVFASPPASWRDLFQMVPEIEPVEFAWILRPDVELKLGVPELLARLHFPAEEPLPKVKMDGKIPVQIAIGNGKGHHNPIQETLSIIRGIVGEATTLFPPTN
jgi:hypothetical protein